MAPARPAAKPPSRRRKYQAPSIHTTLRSLHAPSQHGPDGGSSRAPQHADPQGERLKTLLEASIIQEAAAAVHAWSVHQVSQPLGPADLKLRARRIGRQCVAGPNSRTTQASSCKRCGPQAQDHHRQLFVHCSTPPSQPEAKSQHRISSYDDCG